MSSTKSQVAVATNIPSLSSSQSQKDYSTEESLGRQNSFGNNRRGNMKGKHLTRSHAMRESTSPPRTPTPRAEQHAQHSPNGQTSNYQQHDHHQQQQQQQLQQHVYGNENNNNTNNNNNNNINNNNSHNKLHAQSNTTRGNSPITETPAVIVTSQQQQQQQQQQQNVALCNEAEFPKLTPPKSTKAGGGGGSGGSSGNGGQRNNNNNSSSNNNNSNNSSNSSSNSSSSNGVVDSNNKIEYNSNNNNSGSSTSSSNNGNFSSGKKQLVVDMKMHAANGSSVGGNGNNGGGGGGHETHKNNMSNKHHQQQQHGYNASNALHQALNVGENHVNRPQQQPQQQQQQNTTTTTIHNSAMNYQLNAQDANHHQQQQQQQHQHHHQQQQIVYDKENRCSRNDSQNSSISNMHDDEQQQQQQSHYERAGSGNTAAGGAGGGGGKKHRTNSNSKGTKPRLKNMGGSSTGSIVDGNNSNSNNTSGFISRVFNNSENSGDQFTDHGGTDLLSFFKETLNKNIKDRHFLLKIEKELIEFVQDKSRSEMRFPSASSYNRMLIHRTAAFFGMEHNVDTETQQCVIVAATKNTRIPDIRFKTLVDHRDERKSILKRDTHSFDDSRQSSYLCPERGGMLDRKAKSFEEREEDYERARSRIFNRSQNDSGECMEDSYMSVGWANEPQQQQQQQHQQQQPNRSRSNGKMLKMQNSTESRDGRGSGGGGGSAGAVPKSHSFGGYGGPPSSGGPALMRGDSANSTKSGGGGGGTRAFNKQDSTGSTNTPWRLSPSSSGSIYHFDPSNLPPNQAIATGNYSNQANSTNNNNYATQPQPQPQQQQQQQQQQPTQQQQQPQMKKNKAAQHQMPQQQQQQHQQNKCIQNDSVPTAENMSESSTQTTMTLDGIADTTNEYKPKNSNRDNLAGNDSNSIKEETSSHSGSDECDNATSTGCLSITTTTSTKNYDRIEVQKFKNQATSPNIPSDKEELPKRENSASSDSSCSNQREQPSRNQQLPSQTPTTTPQQQQQQLQHRETPHSSRSTPFSISETNPKRASEEPKPTTWTYTQSYQAPDGSTVFHTTTTPNSTTPYCATTYQQGFSLQPDGSVYAIPQGMVYAYPPPVEGDVQSYFMPVFDPTQQRTDATGLIPAGAQAIYPTTGGTTTMVPVAAAYPTAQFATTNGAHIYPGQVIYSSDQFAGGATVAATAAPANGQLQQIPMTTYPIGYPYPYNGYWGQTMTYYVPQQTLTNAATVTATPLLQAPAPPPPPTVTAAVSGPHVAGGVNLTNSGGALIAATATATAGPASNSTVATLSSGSSNSGGGISGVSHAHHANSANTTASYHTHSGTTYYGTGRVKRPAPTHYNGPQNSHQLMAAIPSNGGATTTYHPVPTLTLAAAPANAAAAANDLSAAPVATPTATMYAVPQHAALFPANMFPYAAAAAAAATGAPTAVPAQPHAAAQATAANAHIGAASGTAHVQQSNAVITPFYAHHPQIHAAPTVAAAAATVHAPGPAAIPIVDPATLITQSAASVAANGVVTYAIANASQSAPSTPHSLHSQAMPQRNPPLFSTPPILSSNVANNVGNYGSLSTPHYFTSSEQQHHGAAASSPHNSYVPSHDKRNSNNASSSGKKPPTYASGNISRQNSNNASYNSNVVGKPPLLGGVNNDTRSSPNNSGGGYHGNARQSHSINKRNSDKQAPLLNGPPSYAINNSFGTSLSNSSSSTSNYVHRSNSYADTSHTGKPPVRLNAAAASFRQKPSGIEYRNVSQRNSPGTATTTTTNSSSNDSSNNNSPNSIAVAAASNAIATPMANCYTAATATYVNNNSGAVIGNSGEQQHATTSVYIAARGSHIPPQMQHGGAVAAGSSAAAAVAATGAAALLGTYNPGASGVYFKYGQTYFAHPSVALPNSRRSPSTDLRPPMTQMTGIYQTMMIQAPPRHTQGRHPNPNYKGTRPR